MKTIAKSVMLMAGLLSLAAVGSAQDAPVQYVKVCSLYGADFHYIPGTDICKDDFTGDSRVQTEGGTWRSLLPYPEGEWVANPQQECTPGGKLVKIGDFKSTDFTVNIWNRLQTPPVNLPLTPPQFISKVMMSGGFYNPRLVGGRSGINSGAAFCLRSMDPGLLEPQGDALVNPPWGDGLLPIGCIANSRIVGMPETYSISATAVYPQIDVFFPTASRTVVAGPFVYGDQLLITTDFGFLGPRAFMYSEDGNVTFKPLAGTLSVSACVDGQGGQGQNGQGQNNQ